MIEHKKKIKEAANITMGSIGFGFNGDKSTRLNMTLTQRTNHTNKVSRVSRTYTNSVQRFTLDPKSTANRDSGLKSTLFE